MKTLKEFRNSNFASLRRALTPTTVRTSSLLDAERYNLDTAVFLSSKKIPLQRGEIWTLQQSRELIVSIFLERPIPPLVVINRWTPTDDILNTPQLLEVIDGKQRITAAQRFLNDEFPVLLPESKPLLYSELPTDWKIAFNTYPWPVLEWVEYSELISDDDKIRLFQLINFSGTPQDESHKNYLSKYLV